MANRSFPELLMQANARLKAAKIRVSIVQKGNRLYIRGTFPPKPGSDKSKPFQQEIALKINANPQGLQQAEKEAKKIGADLDLKVFAWSDHIPTVSPPSVVLTVAEAVDKFEKDHFQIHQKTPKTQESWRVNYQTFLKRLPQNQPLSVDLLVQTIREKTEPDSCSRAGICAAFKSLAEFMGWDTRPIERLKGSYSSQKSCPRDLPSDDEIVHWYFQMTSPEYRWVYGMLATYGLRPHEVFSLDTRDLEAGGITIRVLDGTKTGARIVFPLFEEWIERFNLRDRPSLNPWGRCNSQIGGNVSKQFKKAEVPFPPYNLRHAWAVRSLRLNIDVTMAARWMGHGVDIHTRTYHRWMAPETEREIYERAVRSNTQTPPVSDFASHHQKHHPTDHNPINEPQVDLPTVPPCTEIKYPDPSLSDTAQSPDLSISEPPKKRKRKAKSEDHCEIKQLDLWAV